MNTEKILKELKECFKLAIKEENKGKKHKGLLVVKPNDILAKEFIQKAKINLELCKLYKEKGIDYKIPEEWFYTLYYCALAIMAKFGVESRSQRYTALFLQYAHDKGVIDYDENFIRRITVHKDKSEESEVDEREKSRYSSSIKIEKVSERYEEMTLICKKAINQCEEIVFSEKKFSVPKELC